MIDEVFSILKAMRPPFVGTEYNIHKLVEECLQEADLGFVHEAKIGQGCRVDYLIADVGIEIKKGKPKTKEVIKQLARYADCEAISGLILITQMAIKMPKSIGGKPLYTVVLAQLWGVALP